MKNAIAGLFLISIIFLINACSFIGYERMQGIDIPLENMNDKLRLSAPPELSTFEFDKNLGLVLVNLSDTAVILPPDYGVHIYQQVNNKWESIENGIDYVDGEKKVLPKGNNPFREVVLVVQPFVLSDQPVKVRVVVIGNYTKSDGGFGEKVGAYVDITLKPK